MLFGVPAPYVGREGAALRRGAVPSISCRFASWPSTGWMALSWAWSSGASMCAARWASRPRSSPVLRQVLGEHGQQPVQEGLEVSGRCDETQFVWVHGDGHDQVARTVVCLSAVATNAEPSKGYRWEAVPARGRVTWWPTSSRGLRVSRGLCSGLRRPAGSD